MPFIIYKRNKNTSPSVIGVCNKTEVNKIVDELNRKVSQREDNEELNSLESQKTAIEKKIEELNKSKFRLDKEVLPKEAIKNLMKMQEKANQEIGREIMVKQNNLSLVNEQITKLKEIQKVMYYAVPVKLMKEEP